MSNSRLAKQPHSSEANDSINILKNMALGTAGNMVGTFIALPFNYAAITKQLPNNTKTYPQMAYHALTSTGIKEIYHVKSHALSASFVQSLCFLGIANAYINSHSDQPIYQNALCAGIYSATIESILSAKSLQAMTNTWNNGKKHNMDSKLAFRRSLIATTVKNFAANPLTLFGALSAKQIASERGVHSTTGQALASFSGTVAANLLFGPLVTWQTRVQCNPALSLHTHTKNLLSQSRHSLWHGCSARMIQKGIQVSVAMTIMSKYRNL